MSNRTTNLCYTNLMTVPILDKHIEITPDISGGKPRIKGRRITVQNIAIWHERMGKSADEISAEHGLILAEINESIHRNRVFVEEMRK